MRNQIKRFLEKHEKFIGNSANLLGIGSFLAWTASWATENIATLLPAIAATALLAFALAAYRIHQLELALDEARQEFDSQLRVERQAFNDLMRVTAGLVVGTVTDIGKAMQDAGEIPVTETAAMLQVIRDIRQRLGATPKDLTENDHAFALLAEYERRIKGKL